MQIRKLDRYSLRDGPEEEIPPISYVELRDPEEETYAFDIREVQETQKIDSPCETDEGKTKRSKPNLFLSVIIMLLVTGLFYNFTANKTASSFEDDWITLDIRAKESDFYALCNDIEGYEIAHGTYPESIEDINYSDHITYVRESAQVFELEYLDDMIDLHYDSRVDMGRLK